MSGESQHLIILARRRDYLDSQIAEKAPARGYDFRLAERDALNWVLQHFAITGGVVAMEEWTPIPKEKP